MAKGTLKETKTIQNRHRDAFQLSCKTISVRFADPCACLTLVLRFTAYLVFGHLQKQCAKRKIFMTFMGTRRELLLDFMFL